MNLIRRYKELEFDITYIPGLYYSAKGPNGGHTPFREETPHLRNPSME